jgi:hypothetical protein
MQTRLSLAEFSAIDANQQRQLKLFVEIREERNRVLTNTINNLNNQPRACEIIDANLELTILLEKKREENLESIEVLRKSVFF